jgi:hypothetical protein
MRWLALSIALAEPSLAASCRDQSRAQSLIALFGVLWIRRRDAQRTNAITTVLPRGNTLDSIAHIGMVTDVAGCE